MSNWKFIALLVSATALASCGKQPRIATAPGTKPRAPSVDVLRVQVREGTALVVRAVPVEEYVAATILSEFDPPSGNERTIERMFEVQAIVSRSYAIAERGRHAREGFDLCSTSHCQVYDPARLRTSRWAQLARQAAERTRGQILFYAGAPAEALFHADCGGRTSSAAAVWGGTPRPYLVGAKDSVDHPHDDWTFSVDASSLRDALDGDSRTSVGERLQRIAVNQRDMSGRAEEMTLVGSRTVTVHGEVFREVVSRRFGVRSVRSTLFQVEETTNGGRATRTFVFRGRGFGHGVGLCQDGAFARLAAGASPTAVLTHYFPGTTVQKLGI